MKFIIFTEEEGGKFQCIAYNNDKEIEDDFKTMVQRKVITINTMNGLKNIHPAYIALARLEDDYDFILKRKRDAKGEE